MCAYIYFHNKKKSREEKVLAVNRELSAFVHTQCFCLFLQTLSRKQRQSAVVSSRGANPGLGEWGVGVGGKGNEAGQGNMRSNAQQGVTTDLSTGRKWRRQPLGQRSPLRHADAFRQVAEKPLPHCSLWEGGGRGTLVAYVMPASCLPLVRGTLNFWVMPSSPEGDHLKVRF